MTRFRKPGTTMMSSQKMVFTRKPEEGEDAAEKAEKD
jgi:hypothetical protein